MNMSKVNLKSRMVDWILIQKVRLTNFIKEHKYISAFIGIFLISCIVALIVYATGDSIGVATLKGVKAKKVDSTEEITTIKSFSTVVYEVSYETASSITQLTASIPDDIDAVWDTSEPTSKYELSNGGKTVEVTIYDNEPNVEQTKQLYLNVRNVENGKEIKPTIKSGDNTIGSIPSVTVESEKVELTQKIISGTAYKSSDYASGRLAPFGILVGFDKSKLKNQNSLEGLYFDANIKLVLEATQSVNNINSQIELENNEKYFGLYDKGLNLLSAMPHYKNDYQGNSVYNSGKVTGLTKSSDGVSGMVTENTNPDLYLIGDKTINLEVGEEYTEYGASATGNGEDICKVKNNSCEKKITKKDNVETQIEEKNITNEVGEYIVSYKYTSATGSTTVKRNVKVSEKTTVSVGEDTYSLNGNKEITLVKGGKYEEKGISKNDGELAFGYETSTKKNGSEEPIETVNTNEVGTYTITYTINPQQELQPQGTLTRTVKVVENLSYTKAQTLTASTIYAPSDGSALDNPHVTIDEQDKECKAENKCSVKYYDQTTDGQVHLDKSKAGTYKAVYTVTDENGFEIQAENTINIQTKYDFNIEGIKSDGSIRLYGNDFIALGSYFVNARSERSEGITDNIIVKLKVGGLESEGVVNKVYSAGTKTNELSFNKDEDGKLNALKETDYLSYGEEVVLRSLFSYSSDGDNDIKELTTTIPIGKASSTSNNPVAPFTMIEYGTNVEEEGAFYINEELKDNVTVKYYVCEMGETGTSCTGQASSYDTFDALNDALSKNDKLKLSYLTYTLRNVKPGTVVDFRIRLVTAIGNNAGKITLSSSSSFDENENNGSQTRTITNNSSINVTAFKARADVYINDSNQDVVINGATVNRSVWRVYPSVSMPAELINTNAAGISDLKEVIIDVELPKGVNYIYNENYNLPTVSSTQSGTKLRYVLKGKRINEWIDPVIFETNYDISIASGSVLPIKATIQATSTTDVSDSSSEELRTTTRNITYQNNAIISYSLSTPYSAIPKETKFDVSTKLYNNDSSKKTHSNLEIITILPYNSIENEENNFSGVYTVSNVPNGAMCTTSLPELLNDRNKLVSDSEITWEQCSKYKDEDYISVTAIKVSGISLTPGQSYEQKITINPIGNKTDDSYKISSYLVRNEEGKQEISSIKPLIVSVISKRITGTVWEDFDSNGIMDVNEKKVSGVTLKLYDATNDELIKTTTSDEKGNYSLSDLNPGTYYVVAEYNFAKYGVSPYQVLLDRSITSSFRTPVASDTDSNTKAIANMQELDQKNEEKKEESEEGSDCEGEECEDKDLDEEDSSDEEEKTPPIIKTDNIEITNNTRTISNVNLGLALKKVYSVKLTKYVTRAITTNKLGVSTIKDYGNVTLAKLDVKDISNVSIKVIYTIELENVGYYPGYIYLVKDYVPDGMTFNDSYEENKGWVMTEQGYLENNTLSDQLIAGGEKKYLTIAFDISRKEAGSFVNYAAVDDDDLQILVVAGTREEGDVNE